MLLRQLAVQVADIALVETWAPRGGVGSGADVSGPTGLRQDRCPRCWLCWRESTDVDGGPMRQRGRTTWLGWTRRQGGCGAPTLGPRQRWGRGRMTEVWTAAGRGPLLVAPRRIGGRLVSTRRCTLGVGWGHWVFSARVVTWQQHTRLSLWLRACFCRRERRGHTSWTRFRGYSSRWPRRVSGRICLHRGHRAHVAPLQL